MGEADSRISDRSAAFKKAADPKTVRQNRVSEAEEIRRVQCEATLEAKRAAAAADAAAVPEDSPTDPLFEQQRMAEADDSTYGYDDGKELPLPDQWTEAVDAASGKTYYYHTSTGQSQLERPMAAFAPAEDPWLGKDRRKVHMEQAADEGCDIDARIADRSAEFKKAADPQEARQTRVKGAEETRKTLRAFRMDAKRTAATPESQSTDNSEGATTDPFQSWTEVPVVDCMGDHDDDFAGAREEVGSATEPLFQQGTPQTASPAVCP